MRNVFIIAAREIRQIAGMRSFWLTLLILPLAMVGGTLLPKLIGSDAPQRIMVIDRSGGAEARAISNRFELDGNRDLLGELSRYVQRYHLERADRAAPWSQHDRFYSDSDVAGFISKGGVEAAKAEIGRMKSRNTPVFEPSPAAFQLVPVPRSLAALPDAHLNGAVEGVLNPKSNNAIAVDYVLLIPASFGASPFVHLWARGQLSQQFTSTVKEVLTGDLRARFLGRQGVSPQAAEAANAIAPALTISTPPSGGGIQDTMLVHTLIPIMATYLLMIALILSGSWMLQGTVEERSNNLLETVLACVSPEELMYGKLLGTVAIGMTMIAVWIACGALTALAIQGAIADLLRPSFELVTSPGTIVALIYFFLVGYVAISILFLVVGSLSDSMRDAQGYLMPLILGILFPVTILMQSIVGGNTGGVLIEVLTWVPIWTPFAVLARLGLGIPTWEVIATGASLALFTVAEFILLGRLFRASLLAQGQKPKLAELLSRIRAG